jgi:hydroxyethylthiazole kinase-like uncharacterized protein yjeF
MQGFNKDEFKKVHLPRADSHKGQNGKLLIIGGSHLFHAASLWALTVASRIVDMVFYASVPENNQIVFKAKKEFRNGIVVPRERIEEYIEEADCVLIGPGMVRSESSKFKVQSSKFQFINNLEDINKLNNEEEQTYWLTKYLLEKYPRKKWVIDAGALQMMEVKWLSRLNGNVVITPHEKEFETMKFKVQSSPSASLGASKFKIAIQNEKIEDQIKIFAQEYNCVILLKGQEDIICNPTDCVRIAGGNAGMTKGGTGDVLAGLVAALACKNDLYLSASVGSYINKRAGEELFKKVGYYFNASDLASEIPQIMKRILLVDF